jgi:hypothetical protein
LKTRPPYLDSLSIQDGGLETRFAEDKGTMRLGDKRIKRQDDRSKRQGDQDIRRSEHQRIFEDKGIRRKY